LQTKPFLLTYFRLHIGVVSRENASTKSLEDQLARLAGYHGQLQDCRETAGSLDDGK
jgi:hypothetical protein